MFELDLPIGEGRHVTIEYSPSAALLFFDSSEMQACRKREPRPAVVAVAAEPVVVASILPEYGTRSFERVEYIDDVNMGRRVLAFMGLPVETVRPELRRTPWITYSMMLLTTVFSIWVLIHPEGFTGPIDWWGLVWISDKMNMLFGMQLQDPWRWGGLAVITSFFTHGSIGHLLGNLYFWWIFGDNVEDYLSAKKYLLLIFTATLAGDVLVQCFMPLAPVATIGASGGIAGIIAYYAFRFPHARVGLMPGPLGWLSFIKVFSLPAWLVFILWVAMHYFITFSSPVPQYGMVAHLGGMAAGLFWWYWWRPFSN